LKIGNHKKNKKIKIKIIKQIIKNKKILKKKKNYLDLIVNKICVIISIYLIS
jgi:hypothetical protein